MGLRLPVIHDHWRWLWTALALWLAAATVLGPARAIAQGSGAPADSGRIGLLKRLNLTPTYTSRYGVNRTASNWDQAFSLKRQTGALRAENSWDVKMQENSARNDYRARFGNSKTRLEYGRPDLGGWSTGLDFQMARNFSGSRFDRTVDNNQQVNLFVTTAALGGIASRSLGLGGDALSWSITGSAGVTSDTDVRETRTQGGLLQRADSTDASGTSQGLDTQISLSAGSSWKMDASGRLTRSQEDSKTMRFRPAESDTVLPAVNNNRGRRLNVSSTWSPNSSTRAVLSGQYYREISQSYSTLVQGQDTKDGLDKKIALDLKAAPLWGIEWSTHAETGRTDLVYDVSTQDRGRVRNLIEGEMRFTVEPRFRLFRGVESVTSWSLDDSDNTFETSADYRVKERRFRQTLRRPFGPKVVTLLTGEGTISQSYYEDRSLDRDELRWLLDGAVGYRPRKSIETRVTAQWQERQTINIPSQNAGTNNTQQTYRIGADVACQVNPSVRLTQKYSITADYSFYDFTETNNALTRTTEVRSGLASTIGAKVKLDVDHSFRFKDAGQYLRDSPREPRFYSRATEEIYQHLMVTTKYNFTSGFDIHATQRIEVRESTRLSTSVKTRTKKVDFTGGTALTHKFNRDFGVDVRADRTQTTSEKSYWRITAGVNRTF